ncbi:GGDEF domain-containing protein [Blastococcus brunescens]|uniref:GGDEF domain-containing protein n=1 Tax=Blastococcus brunescens TaxID=1564165 RepID=A0ABZ1B847_9ACTN|nr:GGDEF domain-containing protein [Blastococcus sp. BMG 8361]WRL65851.1 GGDEF domain-containing protein [Blastococcus sp. BMG 8361]
MPPPWQQAGRPSPVSGAPTADTERCNGHNRLQNAAGTASFGHDRPVAARSRPRHRRSRPHPARPRTGAPGRCLHVGDHARPRRSHGRDQPGRRRRAARRRLALGLRRHDGVAGPDGRPAGHPATGRSLAHVRSGAAGRPDLRGRGHLRPGPGPLRDAPHVAVPRLRRRVVPGRVGARREHGGHDGRVRDRPLAGLRQRRRSRRPGRGQRRHAQRRGARRLRPAPPRGTASGGHPDAHPAGPLTGLFNRRYLVEQAPRLWRQARRDGNRLAAMVLDLDHFKRLNDDYGHAAGDAVLREVAGALSDAVRPTDVLARTGGEELLVIGLVSDPDEATHLAERLRAAVAGSRTAEGHAVTASIGVALTHPIDGEDPTDELWRLVDRADAAMYEAKQQGRDRVVSLWLPRARSPLADELTVAAPSDV